MITLFPEIYHDELLYSAIARYQLRVGNIDSKNTLRDIYGKDTNTAMIEMSSNLETLVKKFPTKVYTLDQLINNNTMYSYFTAFMSEEKAQNVYRYMKNADGGKIYNELGLTNKVLKLNRYLRFCPKCYEEDIKRYGETYWHRMHQVAGLDYCVNHKCALINSKLSVRNKNRQEFVNAYLELEKYNIDELVREQIAASLLNNEDIKSKTCMVGEDILFLMRNRLKHYELNYFRDIYVQRLIEMDLANKREVFQDELLIKFKSYWGEEFLDSINCNFDSSKTSNWVTTITRKHRKGFHPIQHILFIRFLGLDIKGIFSERIDQKNYCSEKNKGDKNIEEKQEYRDRWILLMKEYPEYSKTELRKENGSVYRWLYKYDNEWLKNNSPKKKVGKRKTNAVDWEKRDKEVLEEVKKVVDKLRSSNDKPERITITKIGKMINAETLLQKHIDKLPESKLFIDMNVESIEEFQKRRIELVTEKFKKGNRIYSKWDILRKVGIKNISIFTNNMK